MFYKDSFSLLIGPVDKSHPSCRIFPPGYSSSLSLSPPTSSICTLMTRPFNIRSESGGTASRHFGLYVLQSSAIRIHLKSLSRPRENNFPCVYMSPSLFFVLKINLTRVASVLYSRRFLCVSYSQDPGCTAGFPDLIHIPRGWRRNSAGTAGLATP